MNQAVEYDSDEYELYYPGADPELLVGNPINTTAKTTGRMIDSVAGGIAGLIGGLAWGPMHYASQGITSGASGLAGNPNYTYFDQDGNSITGSGNIMNMIPEKDKEEIKELLNTFKTEFVLFKEDGSLNNFKENAGFNRSHRYGYIAPQDYPMAIDGKCRCQSKGPWPHLMHSMDPVQNFTSDAIIYITEEIEEIKVLITAIKKKTDHYIQGDIKRFLKVLGKKMGVDIDFPMIDNEGGNLEYEY